jgi:2-polyprenyl-3-methyl-5-hydroxy-6-metoxy-1,4-benzoquinol methylase
MSVSLPDNYFDQFKTPKYRNKNPVQRLLIRRFVSRVHDFVRTADPRVGVLEIGCGEGFLIGRLSERLAPVPFVGVDANAADLSGLRAKFPQVETHEGSAYDLGFLRSSRRFDLVMCCEVLEHLSDPGKALDEMLSLEPKHVVLSVPHEPWFMLSNLARLKNVRRFGNDEEHVNHWGRKSFRRFLEPRFHVMELDTSYPWLVALARPR